MAKGFSIRAFLGLDTKQFTRGMKGARGKLTNFQKGLRGINDTLRGLKFAAIGVTAVGAFSRAVNTLKDFQTNMARVKVITEASEDTMLRMTEAARKIGAETRFSASEAASGLQFLGMAGLSAEESLQALPSTLDLAGAGMIGVGRSADIVTNVLAGFNLATSEAARVSDLFAQASRKSNQTVEELYEGIKLIAPAYNNLGLSIEEATTDMALLANSGIKAEQAGTALAGALSRLLRQPPLVAKALAELGVKVDENKIKQKGLIGVIQELRDAGINASQMTRILGLHWKTTGALISSTDEEIQKLAKSMNDATGASSEMSEDGIGGIDKAIKLLNSAIDELIIKFGFEGGLAGAIEGVILKTRDAVKWFTELSTAGKQLLVANILLIANFSKVAFALKTLNGLTKITRIGFLRAIVSVRAFGAAVATSLGPVSAIIIAFQATYYITSQIGEAARKSSEDFKRFRQSITKTSDSIKSLPDKELILLGKDERKKIDDIADSIDKSRKSDLASVNALIPRLERQKKIHEDNYDLIRKEVITRDSSNKKAKERLKIEEEARIETARLAKIEEKRKKIQETLDKGRSAVKFNGAEAESIVQIVEAIKSLKEASQHVDQGEYVFLQAKIGLLEKEKKLREDIAKPLDKIKSRGTEGIQHGLKKETDSNLGEIDTKTLVGLEAIEESLKVIQALLDSLNSGGVFSLLGNDVRDVINEAFSLDSIVGKLTESMSTFAQQGVEDWNQYGAAVGNAVRSAIQAYIAEGIAKAISAELGKGLLGVITGAVAAGSAMTLFNTAIPAFATGGIQGIPNGIVPGSSLTGDNNIARVNSREMVLNMAQQRNLFDIANRGGLGGNGRVEFEVKGDKLVGVLNNTKTKNRRF